jgi:hypothetical protein
VILPADPVVIRMTRIVDHGFPHLERAPGTAQSSRRCFFPYGRDSCRGAVAHARHRLAESYLLRTRALSRTIDPSRSRSRPT